VNNGEESMADLVPTKTITEFQVDKYFEAIKQVGTANSAGAFGGLVALYYFKDRTGPILTAIKYATGIYLAGLILFVIAYGLFIAFIYYHESPTPPSEDKPDLFEVGRLFRSILWATIFSLVLWIAGTIAAACVLFLL
jgi:hypothetical protein